MSNALELRFGDLKVTVAIDSLKAADPSASLEPKPIAANSSSLSTDNKPLETANTDLFFDQDFVVGTSSQRWVGRAAILGPRGSGKSALREALLKANAKVRPDKRFSFTALARPGLKDCDPAWLDQRYVFNTLVEEEQRALQHLCDTKDISDACLLIEGSSLGFLDSVKIPGAFFWECERVTSWARHMVLPSLDAVFVSTRFKEETLALAGLGGRAHEKILPHLTAKDGWLVYWPKERLVQRVVLPGGTGRDFDRSEAYDLTVAPIENHRGSPFVVGGSSESWISKAIILGPPGCGKSILRNQLIRAIASTLPSRRFDYTLAVSNSGVCPSWVRQDYNYTPQECQESEFLSARIRNDGGDGCVIVEGTHLGFLRELNVKPRAIFWEVQELGSFFDNAFLVPVVDAIFVSMNCDPKSWPSRGINHFAEDLEPLFKSYSSSPKRNEFLVYWPRTRKVQPLFWGPPTLNTMTREFAYGAQVLARK